jgi:hypothetical protein
MDVPLVAKFRLEAIVPLLQGDRPFASQFRVWVSGFLASQKRSVRRIFDAPCAKRHFVQKKV